MSAPLLVVAPMGLNQCRCIAMSESRSIIQCCIAYVTLKYLPSFSCICVAPEILNDAAFHLLREMARHSNSLNWPVSFVRSFVRLFVRSFFRSFVRSFVR